MRGLVISVTAIGIQEAEKICYPNGAKPGDHIYVSGELGASYLGLQLLEREKSKFIYQILEFNRSGKSKYLIGKF